MQLAIYHCGGNLIRKDLVTKGASGHKDFLPWLAFALRHEDKTLTLIDLPLDERGLHHKAFNRYHKFLFGTLGKLQFKPEHAVRPRLRALGWDRDPVRKVLLTHMHADHTGGLDAFPDATLCPSHTDLDHVRSLSNLRGTLEGYLSPTWLLEGRNVEPVSHTIQTEIGPGFDVYGDGKVVLLSLPGHTPGHQGALLTLGSGKKVLLCGDAAFNRTHLTGAPLGLMPGRSASMYPTAVRTLETLRNFARNHPEVEIIASHDWEWGRQCRNKPLIWS